MDRDARIPARRIRGGHRAGVTSVALLVGAAGLALDLRADDAPVVETAPQNAAAADAPSTPSLKELVARLDSEDLLERERATQRLATSRAYSFDQIESLLLSDELSLEQRHRLTRAARERFAGTPRAAMGVQFDDLLLRTRVVIGKTFEPFASSTMLEEGDMVVEADGLPIVGQGARTMLRSVILAHEPGDALPITVRRGSEKLTIELPLGNFGDLQNGRLDPADIDRAWRVHAMLLGRKAAKAESTAASGGVEVRIIETGVKAVRPLTEAEYRARQEKIAEEFARKMRENPQQAALERGDGGAGGLVAGGGGVAGARNAAANADDGNAWFVVAQNGQLVNVGVGRGRVGGGGGWVGAGGGGVWGEDPFNPVASVPQPSPAEELATLQGAFDAQQKELENLDPRHIGPADQQMIRELRGQQMRRLRMIERQIKAIQAEIDEQTAVSVVTSNAEPSSASPQ